jgi:anti-sigma factor RsiW
MNTATTPHLTDEDLFAFLDGQIGPAARGAAERHLSECQDCRSRAASFTSLFADLTSLPDLQAPRDFTPAVMAAVREKAGSKPIPQLPGLVRAGAVLQLAATLAILLLLAPRLAGSIPAAPDLPDPAAWLDGLTGSLERFAEFAAGRVAAFSAWLDAIRISALSFDRPSLPELAAGGTALLALIASSGLLWLVGNTILFRDRRRISGGR